MQISNVTVKPQLQAFTELFARSPVIPLNNAARTPLNKRAAEAMQNFIQQALSPETATLELWQAEYRRSLEIFAALVDCEPNELTFMPNVASAMSSVAYALNLQVGENIVTVDQEYGSNAYPWQEVARQTGASVFRAQSAEDFSLNTESILALITQQTRAVVISWVQFQTGVTLDLAVLGEAAHAVGALLIVDTTQAVGIVPFSLRHSNCDIVAGSLHKWIGGPPGGAYLATKRCSLFKHILPVGPYSFTVLETTFNPQAQRPSSMTAFNSGTPALIQILGGAAAAKAILDAGIGNLSKQALNLAHRLYQGLAEQGHRLISPEAMTSPIITVHPRQGTASLAARLKAVTFSLRAGGLRFSPHAFNSEDDIDKLLAWSRPESKEFP